MNSSSDTGSASPGTAAKGAAPHHDLPPANWREALMILISTRLTLIELESKDAARDGFKRVALLAIACGCAVSAWPLLLAGGVALISKFSGWPWAWVAIGVALGHLLAAVLFAQAAKCPRNAAFPVTRAEFKKDREWIKNFQKTKKSND